MNGGRSSGSRFLRTDDIRRYLEKKEFRTKSRRWSVCSDDSDSSVLSDSSLRSLPQYSSYRALSSQGSLATMSNMATPTSIQPSKLKQPSTTRGKISQREHHDTSSVGSDVGHEIGTPQTVISRENSFTRCSARGTGIPTPTFSRENSFTKIAKMKRENSLPGIKRETSKTSLKDQKKVDLSSSEILKREKAPVRKEPAPARPRQSIPVSTATNATQISGNPVGGFMIGDRVEISGSQKKGVIQFIGETKFAKGSWAGIVLDEAVGKNDGSVGGVRYFQCGANYGVFVKVDKLNKIIVPLEHTTTSPQTPSRILDNIEKKVVSPSELKTSPQSQDYGLKIGDRVCIGENRSGTLRYMGNAGFAKGLWCGVELDEPLGKNDGAVAGTRYFDCQPKHGLFSPIHKVRKVEEKDSTKEVKEEIKSTPDFNKSLSADVSSSPSIPVVEQHSKDDSVSRAQGEMIMKLKNMVAQLEKEKKDSDMQLEEEKRKCEDLQFQLEEQLLLTENNQNSSEAQDKTEQDTNIAEKEQEIHKMKEELLKTQVSEKTYKEKISELELTLGDFQRRETSINTAVDAERAKVAQFEELLSNKEKEIEELSFLSKEEIFNKEEEIRRLSEELEAQKTSLSNDSQEKMGLRDELVKIKESEAYEKGRADNLQSSANEKEEKIVNLEKELRRVNKEHSDLLSSASDKEGKVVHLEKELGRVNQENAEFVSRLKMLETKVDILQSEKESLEMEIRSNIHKSGNISEQVEQLRDQLVQKNRELTDALTKLSAVVEEKEQLVFQISEQKEVSAKKIAELQQLYTDAQQKINTIEEEIKSANNKNEELLAEIKQSKLRTENLENTLTTITAEKDLYCKERDKVIQEKEELQVLYKSLEEKHQNISEEFSVRTSEADNYGQQLTTLKHNLNEESRKTDRLQRDLSVVKAELSAANEKIEGAKEDYIAIETKYNSACTERDRLTSELEMNLIQLDEAKKEIKALASEQETTIERERLNREALDNDRLNLQNKVEQTLRQLQVKEGELVNAKSQMQELERKLLQDRANKTSDKGDSDNRSPREEQNKEDEVNFLNSVIVDLQTKNKDLELKLKLLEKEDMGLIDDSDLQNAADLNQSGLRPELRPRLFCDICDVFDEHDTEDCPLQSNESENGVKHHGIRGEERPYCTICEVFGHDVTDCDDEEMF